MHLVFGFNNILCLSIQYPYYVWYQLINCNQKKPHGNFQLKRKNSRLNQMNVLEAPTRIIFFC